jgi:hypothetical protein
MNLKTTKRIIYNSDLLAKILDEVNRLAYAHRVGGESTPIAIGNFIDLAGQVADSRDLTEVFKKLASDLKSISNSKSMHIKDAEYAEELINNA